MDFKKLGTFIIAIGLIIVVGSGIFYAMNIGQKVTGGVAFMAGTGNRQAQELMEKKYNIIEKKQRKDLFLEQLLP